MRAVDVPVLRHQMVNWFNSTSAKPWYEKILPPNEAPSRLWAHSTEWASGTLFYFTPEMVEVLRVAAESLPPLHTASDDDLPCVAGVIVLGESAIAFPAVQGSFVQAFSWLKCELQIAPSETVETPMGITTTGWLRLRDTRRIEDGFMPPPLIGGADGAIPLDTTSGAKMAAHVPNLDDPDNSARYVRAAWLLMQQDDVASVRTARLSAAERHKLRRRRTPLTSVRIVSLRRSPGGSDDGAGAGRHYSHRFVVRGHWRNQWYPGKGKHIPKWIMPHVKGPAGAPLLPQRASVTVVKP